MKLRRTCYGSMDTKVICSNCGERGFLPNRPEGKDYVHCHSCCQYVEVDFSEDKEWYSGYDDKSNIYDCLYCGDHKEWEKWQGRLRSIFPNAEFADASDGIHGDRFSIEMRENKGIYRKALIKNRMCLNSLDFKLFMQNETTAAAELFDECVKEGLSDEY